MKKLMSILLAVMLAATLLCAAAFAESDSAPQPENGKKFDTNWAIAGGCAQIFYEEEGYRVYLDIFNAAEGTGTVWEYNCLYNEEKDALLAMSAIKSNYTYDLDTNESADLVEVYDHFLDDNLDVSFTVNANGKLVWNDGVENAGADLEFTNIGRFDGQYRSKTSDTWAEITWDGMDEDSFFYTVYVHNGNDEAFAEYLMRGMFNTETGKLEADGTATNFKLVDGTYEPQEDDGESYTAVFTKTENGDLVLEMNGETFELAFDIGGFNG